MKTEKGRRKCTGSSQYGCGSISMAANSTLHRANEVDRILNMLETNFDFVVVTTV